MHYLFEFWLETHLQAHYSKNVAMLFFAPYVLKSWFAYLGGLIVRVKNKSIRLNLAENKLSKTWRTHWSSQLEPGN